MGCALVGSALLLVSAPRLQRVHYARARFAGWRRDTRCFPSSQDERASSDRELVARAPYRDPYLAMAGLAGHRTLVH